MSLTRFIKVPEVNERFTKEFKLPHFNLNSQLLCPPITNHYGLVGTAFDYLLRFYLKHNYPESVDKKWVAEEAVELVPILQPRYSNKAKSLLESSKKTYGAYFKSGKMSNEVITSAICLSQLDPIFRAAIVDENMGIVDKGDIEDLKNLISCIRSDLFCPKKVLMLNPTFGKGSKLVGGADADLLMDDTLIDIKTTKYLELKRSDFHQIIGYYVLFKIGGIDGKHDVNIKNLGIYFSRHGVLFTVPVDSVFNGVNINGFIEWFTSKAKEHYSR